MVVGLLSAGAGFLLFLMFFQARLFPLFGDIIAFAIITGGIWLCLAVLAVIFAVVAIRNLPKGSMYGKERVHAYIGLALGTTNLLVIFGCFAVLVAALLTPPPPGGYD
jgi:hypothetical protein